MGYRGDANYTRAWADRYEGLITRGSLNARTFHDPLNVTDPRTIEKTKDELDYIFGIPAVANSTHSDEIMLVLQRSEMSKRKILHTAPSIKISFQRDPEGEIIGKVVNFRRLAKECNFILTDTPEGEVMTIGENTLDSGYNEGIYGWVQAGMKLIKISIEQDKYIPKVSTIIEIPESSEPTTESLEDSNLKGPMEI